MMIRTVGRQVLQRLHLYGLYSLWRKGPLRDDGWFRSFDEQRSVDSSGQPVPYITYPAIDFLARRVRPDMAVFEFGSGASTLWWADRVASVVSCEHNPDWYRAVSDRAPRNVTMMYHALEYGGDYSKAITQFQDRFDITSIDGRDRVNCAMNSVGALKHDGVIVWDNSDRKAYEPGYRFLLDQGFRRIEFVGMSPITNERSETSIFYRAVNCLRV
ncbi:MAG TPA: FkbM family methyltransferase [Candidatus Limnocylindria bacterium]|nr:FkbM family methyltransferase [Candidatus Limnocylindria bacterium]